MPDNLQPIVDILYAAGWIDAGFTDSYSVKQAGEYRTYGGRRRFTKGERRCTVGGRTVNFYRLVENTSRYYVTFKATDVAMIRAEAAK